MKKRKILSYEEFKDALRARGFEVVTRNGVECVKGLRLKTDSTAGRSMNMISEYPAKNTQKPG
jgi:hypothetical protein